MQDGSFSNKKNVKKEQRKKTEQKNLFVTSIALEKKIRRFEQL